MRSYLHVGTVPLARAAATALIAVAAGAGTGCDRPAGTSVTPVADVVETTATQFPERTPGFDGDGLNVLLVSVDTTRADHLGCYGHPVVKTPNVDRLAAEGTRFAQCVSSAPLTLPSHTTMLTGTYPFVHGARDNAAFIVAPENVVVAELFKDKGYETHAEVAAVVLDPKYGLDQGFDEYNAVSKDDPKIQLDEVIPQATDPETGETTGPHFELTPPKLETDRKANDIADKGLEVLRRFAETPEPFFMFLHFFDPHWPHEAPDSFVEEFKDGYYAEIAFFDQQFGRVLDALDELGLAENTLVILTADHGEGRGQHGEYTHATFLYDTTLMVPLIMRAPGRIPAGQVVETQVRLLDVTPTICDFVGLDRSEAMQGTTLLPLIADPSLEVSLPCYSDTLVPQNSLNYSPLRSLRVDGWKYILAPRPELYDVANDWQELFNVAAIEEDLSAQMRQELWDLIADSPSPPGSRGSWREPDADEVRKLAALGYVSGAAFDDASLISGSELDHFEPVGANPKDRVEVIELWAAGLGAFKIGKYEEAEKLYRRFHDLEPTHPFGASYLARCLMRQERYDEAIPWFRKAIELDPKAYLDTRMLGTLLAISGQYGEAMDAYRDTLKYNPDDKVARLNLGMLLAAEQKYDLAMAQYDAGLAVAPDEPTLHFHRGLALKNTDRLKEAVESFEEALRLKPDYTRALEQVAVTRHQLGETQQVLEMLARILEENPDEPTVYHALAQIRASDGDIEGAGENFRKVVELLPTNPVAQQNYGTNLYLRGRYQEAIEHLTEAIKLDPNFPQPRYFLAKAYEAEGRLDDAATTYQELLEQNPRFQMTYSAAADLMTRQGDMAGAIEMLRRGYEFLSDNIEVANDLAWHLATCSDAAQRRGEEAVTLAEYASGRRGATGFNELDTLATAYAEVGRFDDAVATAERALAVARRLGQPEHTVAIAARLELFREGKPYHQ